MEALRFLGIILPIAVVGMIIAAAAMKSMAPIRPARIINATVVLGIVIVVTGVRALNGSLTSLAFVLLVILSFLLAHAIVRGLLWFVESR